MPRPLQDISLAPYNTFGLDVSAAFFASPTDTDQLRGYLEDRDPSWPLLIVGEGSNILFRSDYEGLVIHPDMKGIELIEQNDPEVVIRVGAAENWDQWVNTAVGNGWYGLENLSLIPGSVGAAPVQNIGAYGVELKDRLAWVEAFDIPRKTVVHFSPEECRFGYRDSIFKSGERGRYLITHVAFKLSAQPDLNLRYGRVEDAFSASGGSTPSDLREVIIAIRKQKLPDPSTHGNAGSFFKNPVVDRSIFKCIRVDYKEMPYYPEPGNQVKIPAAWLIEKSGWKDRRIGRAGTWPSQPLVIVNYGGASGTEIFDLSERIRNEVEHRFSILLEREVLVV